MGREARLRAVQWVGCMSCLTPWPFPIGAHGPGDPHVETDYRCPVCANAEAAALRRELAEAQRIMTATRTAQTRAEVP